MRGERSGSLTATGAGEPSTPVRKVPHSPVHERGAPPRRQGSTTRGRLLVIHFPVCGRHGTLRREQVAKSHQWRSRVCPDLGGSLGPVTRSMEKMKYRIYGGSYGSSPIRSPPVTELGLGMRRGTTLSR